MLLYIGSYTGGGPGEGVHLARLDPKTGELRHVASFDAGVNPSFLALHPDGRTLYAANETEEHDGAATGAVTALAIAPGTGTLTRRVQHPSEGGAPCHLATDREGSVLFVANYAGGTLALLPIATDGSLAPAVHVERHSGSGPDPERQSAPHPHCTAIDPSNRFAIVTDLGTDRVHVHEIGAASASLRQCADAGFRSRPGAGPRHVVFHPTLPLAYVVNELDSTVTTLSFDRETGRLAAGANDSTLDAPWSGTNQPAGIHVAPDGGSLYVSNRGHDSIAVFTIEDRTGALALEQVVSCGGRWPRDFALDRTGRWLLVANQRSGSVTVLARDGRTGRLTPTPRHLAVPDPACILFPAPQEH